MSGCTAPGCTRVHGHIPSPHGNDAGEEWDDWRPTSGKAEMHWLYSCDLDCSCCNRASFLRKPHTRAMTVEDQREFFRQADALNWKPYCTVVGGEPTLHPNYEQLLDELIAWAGRGRIQLWSNGYGSKAKELVQLTAKKGVSVCLETQKPEGAIRSKPEGEYWVDDIYVAPEDFGLTRRPCFQAAAGLCGVGVDAEGYSPCAMGGTIAAVVGRPCRTKVLADLFDKDKVAAMMESMCGACGHQWARRQPELDMAALPRLFDTPMSPLWVRAFEGRK